MSGNPAQVLAVHLQGSSINAEREREQTGDGSCLLKVRVGLTTLQKSRRDRSETKATKGQEKNRQQTTATTTTAGKNNPSLLKVKLLSSMSRSKTGGLEL